MKQPLVEARHLVKHFTVGRRVLRALHGINLQIYPGETVGLVGESGCGKSTLGRLLLRLMEPTSGSVHFDGQEITTLQPAQLKNLRQKMQIIFQDPYASLNPRMTVEEIVGEPLAIHSLATAAQRRERVLELLELVGLKSEHLRRYPHAFSGGQRQRLGIARAVALEPKFIVCDEPVSALDVNTQEQILTLLRDLKMRLGMTYLFISHDLNVVRHLADRVVVMYLGQIVEIGATEQVYSAPKHPYTQALLSSIPVPDPKVERTRLPIVLPGELPSPFSPPTGCVFHPRCPRAQARCREELPVLRDGVACHFA